MDKIVEAKATLCVLFISLAVVVGVSSIYTAFSNPELTQTQVLYKVLGVD